jgi:hypothetical protein
VSVFQYRPPITGSQRCPGCDIKYPPNFGFNCKVCDGPLEHTPSPPDKDWSEKADDLKKAIAEQQEREVGGDRANRTLVWRHDQLARVLGDVDDEVVWMLAEAGWIEVDLEVARRLKKLGCDPATALRILA